MRTGNMKMVTAKKGLRHVRKDLLLATGIEETEVVTAEVVVEIAEAAAEIVAVAAVETVVVAVVAEIADQEDKLQKKMGLLMGGFFFEQGARSKGQGARSKGTVRRQIML